MIPIRDQNPGLKTPIMTLVIIVAALAVYFGIQTPSARPDMTVIELATIPCEIVTGDPVDLVELETGQCFSEPIGAPLFPDKSIIASLVVSIFLHGSLIHLFGNLWSLWIFGNNTEDAFGRTGFLALYLAAGLAATGAHVALHPDSVIPVIGASGAISGVMGAYLVLFPHARITTWVVYIPMAIPAWIFLFIWFGSQFLISADSGIAWEAHVGGFVFGVLTAAVLRPRLIRRLRTHHFPLEFVR